MWLVVSNECLPKEAKKAIFKNVLLQFLWWKWYYSAVCQERCKSQVECSGGGKFTRTKWKQVENNQYERGTLKRFADMEDQTGNKKCDGKF